MPRFRPTLILLPLLLFLVIYQYRRINGRENSYLETLRHEHILNEGGLTPEHEIHHILLAHTTVIFSKSYCPYSIKVKGYLVDKGSRLKLQPPPYVVELDLHPRGPALQKALEERTGRATVPVCFPSPFFLSFYQRTKNNH
jgi:glutaredoxin